VKLLSWLLFRLLIIVDAGVTKASSSAGFQFCLASQLSLCLKDRFGGMKAIWLPDVEKQNINLSQIQRHYSARIEYSFAQHKVCKR
jgi:hypothetical protein